MNYLKRHYFLWLIVKMTKIDWFLIFLDSSLHGRTIILSELI